MILDISLKTKELYIIHDGEDGKFESIFCSIAWEIMHSYLAEQEHKPMVFCWSDTKSKSTEKMKSDVEVQQPIVDVELVRKLYLTL